MNLVLISEFNPWYLHNTLIWLDKYKPYFVSHKEASAQINFEILSLDG